MNRKKVLGISIGVVLILVSSGLAYALPPRVSWIPVELQPASTAPSQSASYTLTLKHTGILPIPATNQLRIVAEGDIVSFVTLTQPTFPPVFKRGNQVTVRITVSVPASTPLSVKTGQLVLKRILPNGRVTEIWRAEALPVELTFSSFHLPPDPGEAGKATLQGIDSDDDGVRDDIQRYIVLTYPNSEKTRAGLTQLAKAEQAILPDANNEATSINHIQEELGSNDCLSYIYGIGTETTRAISNRLRAQLLNTDERSRAYLIATDHFGGQSYPSVPLAERKLRCNFDPDATRD